MIELSSIQCAQLYHMRRGYTVCLYSLFMESSSWRLASDKSLSRVQNLSLTALSSLWNYSQLSCKCINLLRQLTLVGAVWRTSFCLHVCLSLSLSLSLCVCVCVCLCLCVSVCVCVCVRLCVCVSVCVSYICTYKLYTCSCFYIECCSEPRNLTCTCTNVLYSVDG